MYRNRFNAHFATGADNAQCDLYGDPRRPAVCDGFKPEPVVCGQSRSEALTLLNALELETAG